MSDQGEQTQYAALIAQLDDWQRRGQLEEIIDHLRQQQAQTLSSDDGMNQLATVATLLNKRGIQLFNVNQISEALAYFVLALRARPDDAAALNNAGTCYKELGQLAESTRYYRRALDLHPGFTAAHSNLLMNMHYQSGIKPSMIAAAHRQWDRQYAQPLRKFEYINSFADPERPLRIGLVSADLGQHPVGIFLVRYLENIDQEHFTFTIYADGNRQGPLSHRIRSAVSQWHDVRNLDDEALTGKIAEDHIDILIDLGGHTADNRLGVFVRKPAPLQMGWLGYPGDNGLSAMDYIIGDRFILPSSLQTHMSAKILNLPEVFVCFDPPADAPPVGHLPAVNAGKVTFGCFSNPAKCGEEVISLWCDILHRLPQSRLLLKYKGFGEAQCRQFFEQKFFALGVDASRLAFEGASSMPELFATMQTVDIALDPFPFAGGLMTCLTLWMGVPVLTWPGETFASRQGLSFYAAIGIDGMVAESRQDYVEKAVKLGNDLPRLTELRQKIRPAMAASPLCDGPEASQALQTILRRVWRDKCASVKMAS
jgi:predicted O-linked N-acetylglucosamine transferase (SPINDLY family)